MLSLAGHLHPTLVHLPIGILLLGLFMEWMALKPAYAAWRPAAHMAIGVGALMALLSCITGFILSKSGDYDATTVTVHQWLAISLTIVAFILYAMVRGRAFGNLARVISVLVLALLILTGHWGGTLTHGPGYLTAGIDDAPIAPQLAAVPDIGNANVYTALVEPVLHDNCYRCHSGGHIKGGLDLSKATAWRGKDGLAIQPGNAAASELIKRLLLPLEDEHHMSPKDKPQPTKAEIALLRWWIDAGAPRDKRVADLRADSAMTTVLTAFKNGTAAPTGSTGPANIADSAYPKETVFPAKQSAIKRLEAAGALVLPIAQGSNYLEVSFPNDTGRLDALADIREQLVSLKCSFLPIGDNDLKSIAGCTHLVRLWLDHTNIKNINSLQPLINLRYLNLTATAVSDLTPLKTLPQLKELYLYQTHVARNDWSVLQSTFPHTKLDSGGYGLPFIPTDTAIVRAPPPPK